MSLLDFGNGAESWNVLVQTDGSRFCVDIYYSFFSSCTFQNCFSNYPLCFDSNININQWYHVAFVLGDGIGSLFLDSLKIGSGQFYSPLSEKRNSNFIGRSNWEYDNLTGSYANVVYDEFKIYQGAMTDDEVQKDFSNFFLVLKIF